MVVPPPFTGVNKPSPRRLTGVQTPSVPSHPVAAILPGQIQLPSRRQKWFSLKLPPPLKSTPSSSDEVPLPPPCSRLVCPRFRRHLLLHRHRPCRRCAGNPDAPGTGDPARQRPGCLRRPPRHAFSLFHPRDRAAADDLRGGRAPDRTHPGPRHRPHYRHSGQPRRAHRDAAGEECARCGRKVLPPPGRRPHRAHPTDGLEQLELLGRRGEPGERAQFRAGDGSQGPAGARLELHQHRRRLAGAARRTVQRAPAEQEISRPEGAGRRDPRPRPQVRPLLEPVARHLRGLYRRLVRQGRRHRRVGGGGRGQR